MKVPGLRRYMLAVVSQRAAVSVEVRRHRERMRNRMNSSNRKPRGGQKKPRT